MKLLLDTHAFAWWASGDPKLSKAALAAIGDPANERYLNVVAAFEFNWIQLRGRLEIATPLEILLETAPVTCIDIPFDLHRYSSTLPQHHGDPMDRLMIAHALYADMVFVSCDENVHKYDVPIIW